MHIPDFEQLKKQGWQKPTRQMKRRLLRQQAKIKTNCRSCMRYGKPMNLSMGLCTDCMEKLLTTGILQAGDREIRYGITP